MTHAEMVEEVVKLHEWVKHWINRAEAAEKALAEAGYFLKYKDKAPGDEPGAGSVQQGDEANSG